MSRGEPLRRDWWLVGCAVFAVALAASTTAVVVSDEEWSHSTFVAPATPAVTPTPGHLLSRSTEIADPADPETGHPPRSVRFR